VTWPEVVVIAIAALQVVLLAWIASKQAQVKRDLNGFESYVVDQLAASAAARSPGSSQPGVE